MIVVRKLLDFFFTQRELKILDDVMPESTRRKQVDEEEKKAEYEQQEVSLWKIPHFNKYLNTR